MPPFAKTRSLFADVVRDSRLALMLALGFSSGLPFLLIFSTQSAWLREAGVSRADIGLMSYVALAFTFKFAWAPSSTASTRRCSGAVSDAAGVGC